MVFLTKIHQDRINAEYENKTASLSKFAASIASGEAIDRFLDTLEAANARAGNEQAFLSKNFQAFLAKPMNSMNLNSVIERWVRDKARE